jgi:hypothetical protein
MSFTPNPNAILETVANMLCRKQPGGGYQTVEDAMWWAWNHAFSYDRQDNGHVFWRAVHDKLGEIYSHGIR